MAVSTPHIWEDDIYTALKKAGISQVPYVPDAGHAHLIRRVHDDPDMTPIVLTTEEEGIASSCGAWLGGKRSVLLMQSSGVGNCVNMLSLVTNCQRHLIASKALISCRQAMHRKKMRCLLLRWLAQLASYQDHHEPAELNAHDRHREHREPG